MTLRRGLSTFAYAAHAHRRMRGTWFTGFDRAGSGTVAEAAVRCRAERRARAPEAWEPAVHRPAAEKRAAKFRQRLVKATDV
jgi:hypothetical protein